jgi:transposase
MTYSIGIDIAKDKFDCLWLRDESKLKIKTKVLQNNSKGFEALKCWIEKNITTDLSDVLVSMEATGVYHEPLAYALHEMGVQVSVINPAFIRDFAKSLGSRSKTDKKDSMILARYGCMVKPPLWIPEPKEIRELKALLARHNAIEKDLRRELNRLEKAHSTHSSEKVVASVEHMVTQLKKERDKLLQNINDHIDNNPNLKRDRKLLESIPAIGCVVSREMVALLRSRVFCYSNQPAAFIGLVPKLWESGKLKGRTTLTKNGSSSIRAKLYMAAVVAKEHNPDIKRQYNRLLKSGKSKMQALGAAMRKLVQICFGVLKHQTEYRPQMM